MKLEQALQAYTRDPKALFSASSSSLMHASRRVQPVRYSDAVFAIDVGPIAAGTRVHAVTVDWHKGFIAAFADASDTLNNVPFFTGVGLLPSCEPHTAELYVRETFEFLQRGHSMHHPDCCCRPRRRAHELGFRLWGDQDDDDDQHDNDEEDPYTNVTTAATGYIGYCTVGTRGQGRSVRDVERELGVRSIYGLIAAGGEMLPLMQVLVRLAGLHLHTKGLLLSSPICCVPPEIVTADHILDAARALYPRPLVCAETPFGDLARLKSEGALRVIGIPDQSSGGTSYAVFWRPPQYEWPRADPDVRRLWTEAAATTAPAMVECPCYYYYYHQPPRPSPPVAERPSAAALRCYHMNSPADEVATAADDDEGRAQNRRPPKKKKRAPLRMYGSRRR